MQYASMESMWGHNIVDTLWLHTFSSFSLFHLSEGESQGNPGSTKHCARVHLFGCAVCAHACMYLCAYKIPIPPPSKAGSAEHTSSVALRPSETGRTVCTPAAAPHPRAKKMCRPTPGAYNDPKKDLSLHCCSGRQFTGVAANSDL